MDRPYSPHVFEIIESIITTLASKAEQPPHEKKNLPVGVCGGWTKLERRPRQ